MTALSRLWRRLPDAVAHADRAGGRFLLLAAATGVAVGVGAWAFVEFLRLFEVSPIGQAAASGSWLVFVWLPLGFLGAWAVARFMAPEVVGDGVPEATVALVMRGGLIRGRVAPLKILATGLTVGGGGSAGREGPIVLVGASIGSKVARMFHLGEDQVRSLVAAGAGAGIGATFNAPIAGMLFALEVILASFAVRHMSAIVVASVAAAITSRSLVGSGLTIESASYQMRDARELLLYAGLALVIVAASVLFLRLLETAERWVHVGDRRRVWWRPVVFGLLAAAVLVAEPALLGTDRARLGGTGQEVTSHLLASASGAAAASDVPDLWWVLGLVAVAKILITTLTLTSGGSGGAFMPSLFIGAMVGTAFAKLVGPWWGISALNTGSFAVVGMAAMFAAMGRAPLTAILLVFEVTGTREYGLILPLMATAILATFLAERFHHESVYTMPLRRRGVASTRPGEVDLLDTVRVGSVMAPPTLIVTPDTRIAELRVGLERHRLHGAPVVEKGKLVGIVTVTDLLAVDGGEAEGVGAVMTARPATVTPSTPVSRAMERMAALGVGRLPVVAEDDPGRLVGMFRREEAVSAYHEALGSRTDHHLQRQRLDQRTEPGTGYFDFRVPPGSMADGKAVSEVRWPEGSTLVSVRRGRQVLVPSGATVLAHDDVVTAFGSEASRLAIIERLNTGADEPTAEIEVVVDPSSADALPRIDHPNHPGDLQ